jgi:predicted ATPase/transcriptional regulator with GAF, ATPase, and Fis domain
MVIRGYVAGAALLRTGPYVVHRGQRTADRQPVLLKTVRGAARRAERDALEREFGLLRGLSIAGVPEALDLVPGAADGDAAVLVLDDRGFSPAPGGVRDATGLSSFFATAMALAGTLADVHRADLVCGGVAPSALLVSADGRGIQLVDFSLAARMSVDTALESAPIWGVTSYSSPEQTGRINRTVDHRSDLYSLGATLYHLLTGTPPFHSDDPLGLIHAHLAKTAVPPQALVAFVPEQVSEIVMRLLAKAAEDRYQSALGVLADLDVCAREWHATGEIRRFDLGRSDVSDRFLIPRRLYGRDRELAELTAAFDDACGGRASLLLVSGYSGIGKTSLISELYRPIVTQRGYFLAGKFDQVVRSVPYGALIQAFRGFVWQVLGESEHSLGEWRRRLSAALGTNGGVIAEVIPEIEFVIGRQPSPPALDPAEAQNRFRYVFQNFVAAVGGPEHPLVVFLDDLQWADAATLELLHTLLTGPDLQHVLFIGAYRDNEVDAHHLLTWAVDRLQSGGAPVRRLSLGPLALADVADFLRETLHCSLDEAHPLAELIEQKTGGNPFFVIQFLKTLQHDGLFRFDSTRGAWTFRMDAIAAAGMTDNVIDLMTRNIRRLSPQAQRVLTLAACIGNAFEWRTFLTVSLQSREEAGEGLKEALDAGLLTPVAARFDAASDGQPDAYAFLHDRVQQASYDLMGDEQKRQVHLGVGRLLLAECGDDVPEERLFEIVNHLNIGLDLVTDATERLRAAQLNLAAGRKAKVSAAYKASCGYFSEGIARLSDASWATEYDLMFALRLEAAESYYLAGDFERAEQLFALLLQRAATAADRVQVHSLRIVLYENLTRYADALASARDGLAIFGIVFPERDDDAQALLDTEIAVIERLRAARTIGSLVDLPVMGDENTRTVLRILTLMWAAAYISGARRTAGLISATMVRLSLEHGLTEDTAYGCVTHAITIGPVNRDYASAYEWGELALQLNERFADRKRRAKIHQQYHAHVKLWRRPFATCLPHAREACRSGLESGDFTYAGYGAVSETWPALVISRSLDQFVRDYQPALALLERIRMSGFRTALQVTINWALALQGRTEGPLVLSDANFDEDAFVAHHGTNSAPFFLTFVYTGKLHLCVLLGEYNEGVRLARLAREVTVVGTLWPVLVDFWGGLAMTGAWAEASAAQRREYQGTLEASRTSLKELADNCPENFRCFWLALSGEMARVAGDREQALSLFEEAIGYARETGNLQQEALANELCGRVWLADSQRDTAATFLRAARACYAAWGAATKVAQLDSAYGELSRPVDYVVRAPSSVTPGPPSEGALVDMATVLKMARAIAVEIELDELLRTLMTIALENAGAERGLFLQEREGTLLIEAVALASGGPVRVRQSLPWETFAGLSHAVVRYVRRTGQDLVVANLGADERFASDPYVAATGARSILCVPVGHQGRSAGLLYLENNLTAGAFTPQRIEMMRILAAQAAISIENARLYESMKTEVERRTLAEQSLREAVGELEALKNRLEAENVYLQEEIRTQHNFIDIVGNSPVLLEVLHRVELVGPTESTVLLLGETGSGKELFARAVHSRSQRRDRPLVKVNCGAIPPGLVESELFGHVKGAFTGAVDKRIGRFEVADGGTIMLDEIGELPLDAQVKLLRVLQEQEFEPVGSSRTVRVNVRVIAATNRNLERAVKDGTFRADLLYRLNVFPIQIPPLRARTEDIPLLANLFARGLARKLGKPIHGFSARSMERLMAYSWPGNVRELQNVVERAAILAAGPILEVDASSMVEESGPPGATAAGRADTLDRVQREHIVAVLQSTGGVVEGARGAATILGLHPNTLRSRMKKLGITPASWSSP